MFRERERCFVQHAPEINLTTLSNNKRREFLLLALLLDSSNDPTVCHATGIFLHYAL